MNRVIYLLVTDVMGEKNAIFFRSIQVNYWISLIVNQRYNLMIHEKLRNFSFFHGENSFKIHLIKVFFKKTYALIISPMVMLRIIISIPVDATEVV